MTDVENIIKNLNLEFNLSDVFFPSPLFHAIKNNQRMPDSLIANTKASNVILDGYDAVQMLSAIETSIEDLQEARQRILNNWQDALDAQKESESLNNRE